MTKRALARDIIRALTFKIVALAALYGLFFSPSHRTKITPAEMASVFHQAAPTR